MDELTENDKQVISDIGQYGWHVVKVMGDDQGPGFCFSIGLYEKYRHPEVLIIGLKLDLAHSLINEIGENVKNGKRYDTYTAHDDIIEGHNCFMVEVSHEYYKEYLGYALWYYKNHFPVFQCVYPTVKGIFPWQEEWPSEIKDLQPILGNINKKEGI